MFLLTPLSLPSLPSVFKLKSKFNPKKYEKVPFCIQHSSCLHLHHQFRSCPNNPPKQHYGVEQHTVHHLGTAHGLQLEL